MEAAIAAFPGSEHRAHLNIEIGIVLCRRPDRENQVPGVEFGDLTGRHPVLHHRSLLIDQRLQLTFKHGKGVCFTNMTT